MDPGIRVGMTPFRNRTTTEDFNTRAKYHLLAHFGRAVVLALVAELGNGPCLGYYLDSGNHFADLDAEAADGETNHQPDPIVAQDAGSAAQAARNPY